MYVCVCVCVHMYTSRPLTSSLKDKHTLMHAFIYIHIHTHTYTYTHTHIDACVSIHKQADEGEWIQHVSALKHRREMLLRLIECVGMLLGRYIRICVQTLIHIRCVFVYICMRMQHIGALKTSPRNTLQTG